MSEGRDLKNIGGYTVLEKISQGASGIVYKVQTETRTYALKLLKSSDNDSTIRFRRESSTLARLSHENLVKIYDVGEFEGSPFLVMDFLDGVTLKDELAERKLLTSERAINVIVDVAKALSELHRNNLVHRDIKPSNILITKNSGSKLIDLDLVGDVEQIRAESALVGTPLFISPEQSKVLKRDVDFRSDLYSLGVTLYYVLAGSPPFQGTTTDLINKHSTEIAPDPRTLNPTIWPSIALVLKKMLSKDPDDRYQSASGLLSDLEKLKEFDSLLEAGKQVQLGANDSKTLTTRVSYVRRETESKLLSDAWDQVIGGRAGLVLVNGTSGSGKSRLCSEFIDQVETKNKLVLRAKCQFFDKDLPFGPLREALDSLVEEVKALPDAEKTLRLQAIRDASLGIENQLISFSKSLQTILPKTEAAKESENLEGDREVFFNTLADFFLNLTNKWGATIFFVDDVQWLDEASLKLIQTIFRATRHEQFLLLGTARDDQDSKVAVAEIQRNLNAHILKTLDVGAFNQNQTLQLISKFLNSSDLSQEIVTAIHERSNGIPFIALEYLRAGIEQGFLKFEAHRWVLDMAGLDNIVLAGNVYQLIVKRIDSISQTAKEFLRYAALFGNTFRPDEIAAVMSINPTERDDLVSTCLRFGLVEKLSGIKWKFIHDKIPESLITSLDAKATQDMCDRLANYYVQKSEKSASEIFAVARLLSKGHVEANVKLAVEAHIEAGNLAKAGFAYREAYFYYKFAYERLIGPGTINTKLRFAANFSICATMQGDEKLAAECVDICIANASSKADLAHSYALKVWILTNRCSLVEGWETFKHTCALIRNPYPLYLHWKILQIVWLWLVSIILEFIPVRISIQRYCAIDQIELSKISNMYRDAQMLSQFRGNPVDFYFVSLRLLVMGQLTGSARERAIGYAGVGFIYSAFGLRSLGVSYFERSKKWVDLINDPTVLAWYEMRKLMGFYYLGIINDYQKQYQEKADLFHKYLAPLELARFLLQLGWAVDWAGRHNEAIPIYKFILEAAETQDLAVPPTIVAIAQNYLWQNLAIVGRNVESQAVRQAALKSTNKLRYCPFLLRQVMQNELMLRRMTHELGKTTDEIVTCWWHRVGGRFADPGTKRITGQLGIIRLYQYETAITTEERFSRRLDLTLMLRKMFLSIYSPVYRADYHFIQGAFYRLAGLSWLAELYYRKAEIAGHKHGNLHVLFDVYCDRAKMYIKDANPELAQNFVFLASNLAQREKWHVRLADLKQEFSKHFGASLFSRPSAESSASSRQDFTMRSNSGGGATVHSPSVGSTHHSVSGSRTEIASTVSVGEMRLVEALLDITSAFTISVEPSEQAVTVLTQIVKLFAAERGFIFVQKEGSSDIEVAAAKSSQGLNLEKLTGYSSTVVKRVFNDRKPVVVTGTDQGEIDSSESAVLHNLRSIMAVPLIQKDKLLGVVYLDSSLTKGLFTETDIGLLSTLANHIAVVFEMARMNQLEVEKIKLQHEFDVQAAIASEAKKVKIMVDSMEQALFSVSDESVVIEPVSQYSTSVFGQEIVGKNIFDVLFQDLQDVQQTQLIKSVFSSVYGESSLQWDLMSDNLPRRIELAPRGSIDGNQNRKVIKLQPSPIWNDDGTLERILFVAEDVTTLEALEAEIKVRKTEIKITEELLSADRDDLTQFFTQAAKIIESCKLVTGRLGKEQFLEIQRNLHTLKGNSRLLRLNCLAEQIHKSESELETLRETAATAELEAIESLYEKYLTQFERVYKVYRETSSDRLYYSSELAVRPLERLIESLGDRLPSEEFNKIQFALRRLSFRSVKNSAQRFEGMAGDIAKELNKQVEMEVKGDALADEDQISAIEDCLLHIIRNSLDHGIETVAERLASGKPETGKINVVIEDLMDAVRISVSDDGRGMDPDNIARQALKKGLISESEAAAMSVEDKLNLIFRPNFSTKDQATQISGRGIGIDVAKTTVEKIGGELLMESQKGKGTIFSITLNHAADTDDRMSA